MATWRDDKILELANQLTYSPAEKRQEQLVAAAGLLADVDPLKEYPWDLIHFRITGFQPVAHIDHIVAGKVLRADLSTLVEFLSDTLSITVEEAAATGDAVLTFEEVTKKFSVSSKTIQRWRKDGLIAMRYVYGDGRRRLGFLESAVGRFAAANRERIERSAAFKQLSEAEKAKIVEMARPLAGLFSLKDLCKRIADALHRAPETVRYTLRKHDREHPEAAVFSVAGGKAAPVSPGQSVLHTSVFRLVTQERARQVKALKIEYIGNPLFEHPDADNIILTVLPAEAMARAQLTVGAGVNAAARDPYMARVPRDLPGYLQDVFSQPIMPHELEVDAFRRFHYLRYKAAKLQGRLNTEQATPTDLADIETLLVQANDLKNHLVQSNLRVAVHVARKHQRPGRPLPELVSDASIWLMRAVEKFDFARSSHTRFSTYASYAIMKNFARDRAEALTRRDWHMVTGQDEILNALNAREGEAAGEEIDAAKLHLDLLTVIEELPERERELLTHHYGLDETQPAMSLSEIGDKMGITKARVRQLEARALRKLRLLLDTKREKLRGGQPPQA
jgi:RNA polymerase primary sigma factor